MSERKIPYGYHIEEGRVVKDGYHLEHGRKVPDGHHLEGGYEVPERLFGTYARIVPDDCILVNNRDI